MQQGEGPSSNVCCRGNYWYNEYQPILVGGFKPSKKILVSWDYDSEYMEK